MKTTTSLRLMATSLLWLTPVAFAQKTANPMAEHCTQMRMMQQNEVATTKAQDASLKQRMTRLKNTSGAKKMVAMEAVLDELVLQRKARQEQRSQMQGKMMAHMMEHMQGGKGQMMQCPMMGGNGMMEMKGK